MKKFVASFLLVVVLVSSLCFFTSCGTCEYEFYRYTEEENEFVLCIDINPFRVQPGKEKECNFYRYVNGERGPSYQIKVAATISSDIPASQKNEDGVSYTIFFDDFGVVKHRYDFEKKSWVVP